MACIALFVMKHLPALREISGIEGRIRQEITSKIQNYEL
jgi:hypothetical protein